MWSLYNNLVHHNQPFHRGIWYDDIAQVLSLMFTRGAPVLVLMIMLGMLVTIWSMHTVSLVGCLLHSLFHMIQFKQLLEFMSMSISYICA